MSFLVAPPSHHNGRSPDEGEVDRLLRAFYRAEMPNPWPSFEAPAAAPAVLPFPPLAARRPLLTRSRLALAASVALLVAGLRLLSDKFGTDAAKTPAVRTFGNSAERPQPGVAVPPGNDFKGPYIDGDELNAGRPP